MGNFVVFFELIFHLLFFEVSKHLELFRNTITLTSARIIKFRLGGMLDPVWPYLFLCDARSASDWGEARSKTTYTLFLWY